MGRFRPRARGPAARRVGMSAAEGLPPVSEHPAPFGTEFMTVIRDRDREREADEFYTDLARPRSTPEENRVLRQPFAGMLWGMQYCWRREARAATGQRRERGPSAVLVDQSRQHDPEHEHEDTDEHERATHDRSTARCRLDGRPDGRARDRTYWCCIGHQARTMKPAANRSLSLAGHKRCSCRSCPGLPRTYS